jgi:hypothetical protein
MKEGRRSVKARIPERQRILNPKERPTIRAMLQRCAVQTLIEVFERIFADGVVIAGITAFTETAELILR